jgi:LPXTG-site transpeptidase (sortase) family protein
MRRTALLAASVVLGALLAPAVSVTAVPDAALPDVAAPGVGRAVAQRAAATSPRAASRRLVIPAIGVDAGIVPVGITGSGQLDVGGSVRAVYRWRYGVVAGRPGSAVLAGHTWSRGNGVFDRLGSLRPGDRVRVGRVRFAVTRVRRVTGMAPKEVRGLFSDRGRPRLVLITCGDRNNATGVYRTRIIVNAKKL